MMYLNQLSQRPGSTLRHWQRKGRVLARRAGRQGNGQNNFSRRVGSALLVLLLVALGLLASPTSRHWLSTAFANVAIVGGIVAAPIISLVAWIGVALPVHAPLHQAAPTLFIGALLWMLMAFVSAHARRDDANSR